MRTAIVACLLALAVVPACGKKARPLEPPLVLSLDGSGPYLILTTAAAQLEYEEALQIARRLHPGAQEAVLDPENPEALLEELREVRPRHVLVFLLPGELDVNLGWRLLTVSTQVDADPFADFGTGFVTGATPEAARDFLARTEAAIRGREPLTALVVDLLGPTHAPPDGYFVNEGTHVLTALESDLRVVTISHGKEGYTDERLRDLIGVGLLHIGGHGYPDGIVDGMTGRQAGRLDLSPSAAVVFNGACYTGVTDRWFVEWTPEGRIGERRIAPEDSFCLNLLRSNVLANLASLHPDHGIPVYQEMEYMVSSGASLGEVMRRTYDAVVMGAGGALPDLEPLVSGAASIRRTPSQVMLVGTASRVLFGDPALVVSRPFAEPVLEFEVAEVAEGVEVTATVANPDMKFSLFDTFHADLSTNPNLFNDRAWITVPLPDSMPGVSAVEVVSAVSGEKELHHRLVGWAVEEDGGERFLHAQVDVPTRGYMQSDWRQKGARVRIRATR